MSELLHSIYTGTLQKFNKLPTKDINSLYMVYDEDTGIKSMYRGNIKVSGDFIIINGLKPSNPSVGQIYYISNFIDSETNKIYPFTGFFNGEKWIPISNNKEILSIEKRLSVIEGEGEGSIKKAVLDAKNEIIGDATTEFNNLGKIETKINETATIWEEY